MSNLQERLMQTSSVRNLGITAPAVESILDSYNKILIDELLKHGSLDLNNGIYLEIVKLTPRVHVLRGVSYAGTRKYKLKAGMDDEVYSKINEYYSLLEDEV